MDQFSGGRSAAHEDHRVVVDHCTGECLGVRAALRGTRFEAIECLREAIHFTKGRYEDKIAEGKKLRHEHGSYFISHAL